MGARKTSVLKLVHLLLTVLSTGSCENDRDFNLCGTWSHGNPSLRLYYNISTGCSEITVSANESTLSIEGQITAKCMQSREIPLERLDNQTYFCLYWDPLMDQLKLQLGGKNYTLCQPAGLQGRCCTDLSEGPHSNLSKYGIFNTSIRGDVASLNTRRAYKFFGETINCKREFCNKASQGSNQVNIYNRIEDAVMRSQVVGKVDVCGIPGTVVEMGEDFHGHNVTLPVPRGVKSMPSIYLPSSLKPAARSKAKVVCTFIQNGFIFQDSSILDIVVGITVENEVVSSLTEPVKIGFHHDLIPLTHSRSCVSWDSRKDPTKVNWSNEGCLTIQKSTLDTECRCNHLTYFSILVQLEHRPVRHLLVLTVITLLGCALSVISCVVLIVFLCRKRRSIKTAKEQSLPIHLGLAISLFFLNVFFFFTGILANVGGENVCRWVAAALHCALLSSLFWMAIEVFHTFWLVCMLFYPTPKPYVWNLIGFGIPFVTVIVLLAIGDIYGIREVIPAEDTSNPYLMCWMKNNFKAEVALYSTSLPILAIVVVSGLVMLFVGYRQIKYREEWRQKSTAFLSIWGLSCLYGTTWGLGLLGFLDLGPLTDFLVLLFCIFNSFQGFFLVLRFFVLDRLQKKNARHATLGGSSTGSTRQYMLQTQGSEEGLQGDTKKQMHI